jgi:hypothetical protein
MHVIPEIAILDAGYSNRFTVYRQLRSHGDWNAINNMPKALLLRNAGYFTLSACQRYVLVESFS